MMFTTFDFGRAAPFSIHLSFKTRQKLATLFDFSDKMSIKDVNCVRASIDSTQLIEKRRQFSESGLQARPPIFLFRAILQKSSLKLLFFCPGATACKLPPARFRVSSGQTLRQGVRQGRGFRT